MAWSDEARAAALAKRKASPKNRQSNRKRVLSPYGNMKRKQTAGILFKRKQAYQVVQGLKKQFTKALKTGNEARVRTLRKRYQRVKDTGFYISRGGR